MRQRSTSPPDEQRPEQRASTWLQVVFGGMSVTIALVAAVIAYFAWVQPHAPADEPATGATNTGATNTGGGTSGVGTPPAGGTSGIGTPPAGGGTDAVAKRRAAGAVRLATLEPALGGTNVRRTGADLVMPCATGQSTDRQRTVEYDLLGRYATAEAALTMTKSRDGESPAQIKVLTDGLVAATVTVTRDKPGRLNVPVSGRNKMRLQLTCQFPDSEVTIGNATLIHS